jgi:hypothetical protein
LTKPIYSDLDNLSNDYRKINIIDYQSVDYNLFYARDSDWFLYFVITIIKYDIVGVPLNDNSFDKKRILELNYVDQKQDNFIEDFDQMDTEKTGYLTKEKVKEFLNDASADAEVDDFFSKADADSDGKVSFAEYFKFVTDMYEQYQTQAMEEVAGESFNFGELDEMIASMQIHK